MVSSAGGHKRSWRHSQATSDRSLANSVKLAAEGQAPLILPGNRNDLSPVALRNVAKALGYRNPSDLARDRPRRNVRRRGTDVTRRSGTSGQRRFLTESPTQMASVAISPGEGFERDPTPSAKRRPFGR